MIMILLMMMLVTVIPNNEDNNNHNDENHYNYDNNENEKDKKDHKYLPHHIYRSSFFFLLELLSFPETNFISNLSICTWFSLRLRTFQPTLISYACDTARTNCLMQCESFEFPVFFGSHDQLLIPHFSCGVVVSQMGPIDSVHQRDAMGSMYGLY